MGLSSNKEDIIIIENPEIHLHPLSQSRLCEFLYFVSHGDRQVIIETHSDHFFNAIRAGIATNEMKKEDILIEFFKLGSDNCTREYDISIGENMVQLKIQFLIYLISFNWIWIKC